MNAYYTSIVDIHRLDLHKEIDVKNSHCFIHPISKETLTFSVKPPKIDYWKEFDIK